MLKHKGAFVVNEVTMKHSGAFLSVDFWLSVKSQLSMKSVLVSITETSAMFP